MFDYFNPCMKKILILEDERVIAGLYAKKLMQAGFETAIACDTEEAIKIIHNFSADCIFIDHGIRGKSQSGSECIPFIKKQIPNAKIVMLSNYESEEIRNKAMKMGAMDFLIKINFPPQSIVPYVLKLFR